jgi:predicted RNA polymerase sigma factor
MSAAEEIPRRLPERTGSHRCVACLAETPGDAYFANDHLCDACAAREEYPLASTPKEPAAPAPAPARKRRAGG